MLFPETFVNNASKNKKKRGTSQYRVCTTLSLIRALYISCTLNDVSHRNTSPNPQEGCTVFSYNCLPWLGFAKSSLNLTHRCSIGFSSGIRTGHGITYMCGSCCMSTSVVMLKSVVPMTINKWHHMGSQNLIHVASGCNPITSVSADVNKYHQFCIRNDLWQILKDDGSFVVQYIIEMLDTIWLLGRAIWRLHTDGCCLHYIVYKSYYISTQISYDAMYTMLKNNDGFSEITCIVIFEINAHSFVIILHDI